MSDFFYIKRANGSGIGFNWSHVVAVNYHPGGVDEIGEDGPPGKMWPPSVTVRFATIQWSPLENASDSYMMTFRGVETETIIEKYQRRATCYTLPTD